MDDPAKVLLGFGFFATVAVVVRTVGTVIAAYLARQPESPALGAYAEERLARIEQAVDAIAIEVERISEGQRFTTKLLSERTAAPGAPPKGSER